jgi:hypothetical protein
VSPFSIGRDDVGVVLVGICVAVIVAGVVGVGTSG